MPSAAASLLAELVGHPSTSDRDSTGFVKWLVDRFGRDDAEVTVQRYAGGTRSNLLLVRGGPIVDDAGLLLAGHLDVVPAEEPEWRSDPWTLTDGGDRWVGRGACDMKGFVALALDRFGRSASTTLQAPLAVLLTSDEEVGSIGAQRWVERLSDIALPRQVLIGEPTDLRPVRMHKGHLRLRLEIRGTAAHSGYPHRGHSAIRPAGPALVALAELERELATETPEHGDRFPEVPFVALNVGRIDGGAAVNVIPDRCVVEFGLRLLPGLSTESVLPRGERTLDAALRDEAWDLEVDNDSPPLLTAADAPLYLALGELFPAGDDSGVSYSSDGGALARLGLDCVLFGPGSIEVAHKPNEFVPKAELERAGEIIDRLIDRFCGVRLA